MSITNDIDNEQISTHKKILHFLLSGKEKFSEP